MTLQEAKSIAQQYRLALQVEKSYREFKPWWAFWITEDEAVRAALTDWGFEMDDPRVR